MGVGDPEAAVLLGGLHAERAELEEAFEHRVGDLCGALDLFRVHVAFEEGFDLPAKGFAGGFLFRRLRRREEQGEIGSADEDARYEARPRQALAGFLDPLHALEEFRHGVLPRRREIQATEDLSATCGTGRSATAGSPQARARAAASRSGSSGPARPVPRSDSGRIPTACSAVPGSTRAARRYRSRLNPSHRPSSAAVSCTLLHT